jgi:unsaturated rhamnogalacturonyl hydrolase
MWKNCTIRLGQSLLGVLLFINPSLNSQTSPIEWAKKVVESTMRRKTPSNLGWRTWEYDSGFYLFGQYNIWKTTGQDSYFQYIKDWVDLHVNSNGTIDRTINDLNYFQPGLITLLLCLETGEAKYRWAVDYLRNVLKTYPKTSDGGFWQNTTTEQLWLDGAYMVLPFLAKYGQVFGDTTCLTEAANHIIIVADHLQDPSGLLYHVYDEDGSESWADPVTHHSPYFWGRSIGWYGMAIVEILDCIPQNHPKRPEVIHILADLIEGLSQFQDQKTGLWYQVVDMGNRPDNWLETSCSCMFAYVTERAVEKGYVDSKYKTMARNAYEGILKEKMNLGSDGLTNLKDICGGTVVSGDYSYYASRPRNTAWGHF